MSCDLIDSIHLKLYEVIENIWIWVEFGLPWDVKVLSKKFHPFLRRNICLFLKNGYIPCFHVILRDISVLFSVSGQIFPRGWIEACPERGEEWQPYSYPVYDKNVMLVFAEQFRKYFLTCKLIRKANPKRGEGREREDFVFPSHLSKKWVEKKLQIFKNQPWQIGVTGEEVEAVVSPGGRTCGELLTSFA